MPDKSDKSKRWRDSRVHDGGRRYFVQRQEMNDFFCKILNCAGSTRISKTTPAVSWL